MPNNFSITARNFVSQKTLKIEGVIFEFLVLKITNFQCCVRKKRKLDDYDYLGRLLLQVYRTFLNVFSCGHRTLCPSALPHLH